MQLPAGYRLISVLGKATRERHVPRPQVDPALAAARFRQLPRHQALTGRNADGRRCIGIAEDNARTGQLVENRRTNNVIPRIARDIGPMLVTHQEENVRTSFRCVRQCGISQASPARRPCRARPRETYQNQMAPAKAFRQSSPGAAGKCVCTAMWTPALVGHPRRQRASDKTMTR